MIDRPLTLDWETINWLTKRVRELEAELERSREAANEAGRWLSRTEKAERELLLKNESVSTLRLEADRWAARAEKAEAELGRLRNRTLEQVISEEWGSRGMTVIETFDGTKSVWTIEAREREE